MNEPVRENIYLEMLSSCLTSLRMLESKTSVISLPIIEVPMSTQCVKDTSRTMLEDGILEVLKEINRISENIKI